MWGGSSFCSKTRVVAWEKVCAHKNAGGLGFRDIVSWNTTSLGKYVWRVSTKHDSVLLKWIHFVYIKGADWWSYKPIAGAS